jgi:hypothetical protein
MFAFVYNPLFRGCAVLWKLFRLVFYSLPLIAFAANLTEPRAEVVPPAAAAPIGTPAALNVTIFKSHPQQLPRLLPAFAAAGPFRAILTPLQVRSYVRTEALEHGVDPQVALWIVKHESSYNPRAKGDGEASRGLWQISRIYHPEVSDAMAFNVTSSTAWSLQRIRSGKANEWSSYRYCRSLYGDCPF